MEREEAMTEEVPAQAGEKRPRGFNLRRENRKPSAGKADNRRSSQTQEHLEDPREQDLEVHADSRQGDLEDERFRYFEDNLSQSVLPDPPQMPGWHYCWLTTTNPRDPVSNRISMGYELVTPEMLRQSGWRGPEMATGSLKSAGQETVIMINEMVLARIPVKLAERMMGLVHHDLPLSEEQKLKDGNDRMRGKAAAMGSALDEGDGTAEIVQRAQKPKFFS